MQLALPRTMTALKGGFRLPSVIPPFNKPTYWVFSALWFLALILAIAGPIAGFYFRSTEPANNSQLLIGSRAGFAVAPRDATLVRFTVGPASRASGIRPGDHIVAIYGLPLPPSMPVNEATLAAHADDPAYIAMGNLLFGGDNTEIPLTVRSSDGKVRDVTVTTGEQHIDGGARALGISPKLLSFIDLLHVLAYPFLLWAAWLLHRRNSTDVVSSILSLAVLLNIAAEQPSSVFLAQIGVPRGINVALYDLGNVLLLAGILLFPHGNLSLRRLGTILCLPALFFLRGTIYETLFVLFMITAVLSLVRWLHKTESADQRQQIRWALLGISGYAVLRCISIVSDYLKWSTWTFGQQLLVETAAGISFALAGLILQLGLFDRSSALSPLRRGGRDRPVGELRRDHSWCRGHLRGRWRCLEADRLQLFGKQQQRGANHLRGSTRDDHGQSDSGSSPALVGEKVPEEPLSPAQRPPAERPRYARNCVSSRHDRRNPGAGRSRRPRRARGDGRQWLRNGCSRPHRRRGRGMARVRVREGL